MDPRPAPTSRRRDFARQGPWLLASSLVLAILVAPFALGAGEGKPVRLGKRNPAKGASSRTSHVVAKTKAGTYTLRADNRGRGGSLLAGCRTPLGADLANPKLSTACVRGLNSGAGEAFQFHSLTGTTIGILQTGAVFATPNPNARPFITNATGEATGLNADKVDGLNAADIIAQARQANPAGSAPSFAFARVSTAGATDQSRTQGVTDSSIQHPGVGVYCFNSLTSRPKNANVTLDGVPGETSVDTTTKPNPPCQSPQLDLVVRTYDSTGNPADKPFYIAITGTTG